MFAQIRENIVINLEQIVYLDIDEREIHLVNRAVVWCDDAYWDSFYEKLMEYKRK